MGWGLQDKGVVVQFPKAPWGRGQLQKISVGNYQNFREKLMVG